LNWEWGAKTGAPFNSADVVRRASHFTALSLSREHLWNPYIAAAPSLSLFY